MPLLTWLKITGSIMAVLGVMAIGLRLLNTVPGYLSPPPLQTYATLEEAGRSTGVHFYTPAYYPDYLQWPPYDIRGWVQPQKKVAVTLALQDSRRPVLWLEEWYPVPGEALPSIPRAAQLVEKKTVSLHEGVEAQMVAYKSSGDQLYYRLIWDEGNTRVAMTALLPPSELLHMAMNMRPLASY